MVFMVKLNHERKKRTSVRIYATFCLLFLHIPKEQKGHMKKHSRYGITYQGSKNQIAKYLLSFLPSGKRFVDLFGGGFAMSHCALLSGKYEQVLYNDNNPLIVNLIKEAINGKYDLKNFKPQWVSKEEFDKLKKKDGYIKYCWSFSCSGKQYLYGKDIVEWKKAYFYACLGDFSLFNKMGIFPPQTDTDKTGIIEKRLFLRKWIKKNLVFCRKKYSGFIKKINLTRLENLEELENLGRLEHLEKLEHLQNLEIKNMDYQDYVFRDGDVVFCDPPYQNTHGYTEDKVVGTKTYFSNVACNGKGRYYTKQIKESFDSKSFYDWVFSRDYQVFFTSYDISDKRFFTIAEKNKFNLLQGGGSKKISVEKLYSNKNFYKEPKQINFAFA